MESDEQLLARILWPPEEGAPGWPTQMDGEEQIFDTEVEALRWALARLLRRADRLARVANAAREAELLLLGALLGLDKREG